jgi:hypothetical protein
VIIAGAGPVGARILDWTRAQVALMRPDSRALAAIVRDLIDTRDGANITRRGQIPVPR